MRPATLAAPLLVLMSVVVVQGSGTATKFEDVIKEMLGIMGKLSTTLEGIKDEDTAKAAKPDLRTAAGRWVELRKKSESMKPPAKEEKDRLEKEYKEKLLAAQKKLFGEIARVKTVPGGPDALKEIVAVVDKEKKPK